MTALFYLAAVIAVVWLAIWTASDETAHGPSAAPRRRGADTRRRWNPFEFVSATVKDIDANSDRSTQHARSRAAEDRLPRERNASALPQRAGAEPRWRAQRQTQRRHR